MCNLEHACLPSTHTAQCRTLDVSTGDVGATFLGIQRVVQAARKYQTHMYDVDPWVMWACLNSKENTLLILMMNAQIDGKFAVGHKIWCCCCLCPCRTQGHVCGRHADASGGIRRQTPLTEKTRRVGRLTRMISTDLGHIFCGLRYFSQVELGKIP